ncbi:hypothetical protein N8371_09585 [Vicingaceae bacterium]|nr:hypothetical protein [Vicingaceae bacterium]MDB4060803.1 hypothetical protein [Vicingaceae bacterium]MDC0004933.1 hypothetical protein [bacterium]MDC1452635.1 hypothetical protein [Vicingaceae bacterium]
MTEKTPNQQADSANKVNKVLVALVILLSLALGITLWQFFDLRKTAAQKGSEIEIMADERGELQNELEQMLNELDTMETANDSMKVELSNRKNEIEGLLAKVKDKDFAIYKLRKETTTLRTIMKGYVVVIDSINTLNIGLRNENTEVRSTLKVERSKAKELQQKNDNLSSKVALASRLDVSEIRVFGVNVKKDMTGKETDRARRSDKIRACFKLNENKVAKAGKKPLYLRIIAPDGKILTAENADDSRFEFREGKGYYSGKIEIDYNQSEQELCLDWVKPIDEFEVLPGVYQLYIYAEDYEMAAVSYELR